MLGGSRKVYGASLPDMHAVVLAEKRAVDKQIKSTKRDSSSLQSGLVGQPLMKKTGGLVIQTKEEAEARELAARRLARERLLEREAAFVPTESEKQREKRLKEERKLKRKMEKRRKKDEAAAEKAQRKRQKKAVKQEAKLKADPQFWNHPDIKSFMSKPEPFFGVVPVE